jgi:hypothetical protein
MTAALTSDTLTYSWRIEQGERERLEIPILNADGDPFVITGWTVDAKVKTEPGGTVLYTWPASSITIASNLLTLEIPGPVSAAWTWTTGWWRAVITEPNPADPADPDVHRVIQGTFIMDRD